jgi:hypothetical protein
VTLPYVGENIGVGVDVVEVIDAVLTLHDLLQLLLADGFPFRETVELADVVASEDDRLVPPLLGGDEVLPEPAADGMKLFFSSSPMAGQNLQIFELLCLYPNFDGNSIVISLKVMVLNF